MDLVARRSALRRTAAISSPMSTKNARFLCPFSIQFLFNFCSISIQFLLFFYSVSIDLLRNDGFPVEK